MFLLNIYYIYYYLLKKRVVDSSKGCIERPVSIDIIDIDYYCLISIAYQYLSPPRYNRYCLPTTTFNRIYIEFLTYTLYTPMIPPRLHNTNLWGSNMSKLVLIIKDENEVIYQHWELETDEQSIVRNKMNISNLWINYILHKTKNMKCIIIAGKPPVNR